MQTTDMILVKKKRIAIDRKRARNNATPTGLWGRISSVTQRPPGAESNLNQIFFFFNKTYFCLFSLRYWSITTRNFRIRGFIKTIIFGSSFLTKYARKTKMG